jgi:RNA polymerase sigma-70 factor (ECF subfamily)
MVGEPVPANVEFRTSLTDLLPEMRGFARFLVRDRVEADDLVQDAIVRALTAADQFVPGTNIRAWVFTILRNLMLEKSRRRRTEQRILEETTRMPDDNPLHSGRNSADIEKRAEIEDLQKSLWKLSAHLREAIILVGAHELEYEEAAMICNVPVGTMKARVSRARAQLALLAASRV